MAKFGDFQTCLEEGKAFMDVGKWCETEKADQLLFGMMYPCVTNYAFSCEVLLKAIELHFSPNSHHSGGHGLEQLFEGLPDSTKQQLKQDAATEGIIDLSQFLKEHDLSFVDWRYAFENETVKADISKLSKLASVLYSYVRSLTPNSN